MQSRLLLLADNSRHTTDNLIYVGIDTFIYYQEGDATKFVAPDIYVVLGVEAFERRSFYTWAEGTAPHVVFEFLSESTAARARGEKVKQYLLDIGVQEYFVHQPERAKPPEFRGGGEVLPVKSMK